jgi:hypothetical protein
MRYWGAVTHIGNRAPEPVRGEGIAVRSLQEGRDDANVSPPPPGRPTMLSQDLDEPLDFDRTKELTLDDHDGTLCGVEDILQNYRSDAYVLEEYGHVREARLIHVICSDVRATLADFIAFVNEDEAVRLTKRSRESLREKFPLWEQQGHAWMQDGTGYHYRAIVLGLILPPPEDVAPRGGAAAAGSRLQPE